MERVGFWGWPLAVLMLLPAFVMPLGSDWALPVFGLASNFLGFALLISLVLWRGLPTEGTRGSLIRSLAKVGTWSYGIYLWHLEILGRLEHYGMAKVPAEVLLVLGVFVSIAFGALVTHWVERPFLRMRERFFK